MNNILINQIKALSNKHRIHILNIIHQNNGNLCYANIYEEIKMPSQTFNYHIKKLENAKIISSKRKKQKQILAINYPILNSLKTNFNKLLDF